ncbi:hypothetical protein [Azotobacter armeniacus]
MKRASKCFFCLPFRQAKLLARRSVAYVLFMAQLFAGATRISASTEKDCHITVGSFSGDQETASAKFLNEASWAVLIMPSPFTNSVQVLL